MTWFDVGLTALKVVIIQMMILNIAPLLIWVERKGCAYIQDRRGPNRATILGLRLGGLFHALADVVKLITKADSENREVSRPLFILAPLIAVFISLITVAIVPFTEPLVLGNFTFNLQIADLSAGLLYVLAFSSLAVYALLLAGWSSGGNFSLIGALRAASQMVSYEISMGLSVVAIFMVGGSFRLGDLVAIQGENPFDWFIVKLPIAFILFFTALFAETNRLPFDLPEGESELTAGYHTEYSSMRFAMFFMGEYIHITVGSLLITMLFLGGWNLPYVSTEWLRSHSSYALEIIWVGAALFHVVIGAYLIRHYVRRRGFWGDARDREGLVFGIPALFAGLALGAAYIVPKTILLPWWVGPVTVFGIQMGVVLAKTLFFCWVFIWVRWTLPRFRYDQLMRLGWKSLLPLALANIVLTGVMVLYG
ncbi:MAG: NADH-quinone oxidoreductase subunit H [Deltaproteobacteria bacterium]|nr:NADH-quinone oxidoreductase subunit H [Deltaproteobacteria bacterium]